MNGLDPIAKFLGEWSYELGFGSIMFKFALALLLSAIIGCVALVGIGAAANYFIAPLYFKYFVGQVITEEFLMTYLVSATSLNIVKGAILSVVAYPIILLLLDKI